RKPHDRRKRLAAKKVLDHPPVLFTGLQARAVARGFANCVRKCEATVWACAVMPDHMHLVVARHKNTIEVLANLFKGEATKQLVREGIHPFQGEKGYKDRVPSCFARKWWAIFLDTEEEILRTIPYVENNPLKAGLKPQSWGIVVKYPGLYQPEKK